MMIIKIEFTKNSVFLSGREVHGCGGGEEEIGRDGDEVRDGGGGGGWDDGGSGIFPRPGWVHD